MIGVSALVTGLLVACGPPAPPPGSCRSEAPPNVVAGEPFAWRAECTLPDGASGPVIVAFPSLRDGPRAWRGPVWLVDPAAPGFIRVRVDGRAVEATPISLDDAAAIRIDISPGVLLSGMRMTIDIGRGDGETPVAQAPTIATKNYVPRVLVRGASGFVALAGITPFDIAPGPASRVDVVAPSAAETKKPFGVTLRVADSLGNLAAPSAPVRVFFKEREDVGIDLSYNPPKSAMIHAAVTHLDAGSFDLAGFRWIVADTGGAFATAMSNPIAVSAPGDARPIAFGDLDLAGENGESLGLGFAAIADPAHAADDALATSRGDACASREQLGRFVPLIAREFSGSGRALALFDRCAVKAAIGASATWWEVALAQNPPLAVSPGTGRFGAVAWSNLLDATGGLLAPFADSMDEFAAQAERVRAVALSPDVVTAGIDHPESPAALAARLGGAGRRFGIVGVRGALTGMLSGALTRRTVYDAVASGRAYVTSGARMLLYADVDGKPPGREYAPGGPPVFHLEAAGTAPIQSVELLQDGRAVFAHAFDAPAWVANEDVKIPDLKNSAVFIWRVAQTDGHVAWSSPFFVRHPNWSRIADLMAESMGDAIEIRFDFAPGLNTIDIELRRRAGDDGGGDPKLYTRISGRWPPGPVVVRDDPANAYGEAVHYLLLERNAEGDEVIARAVAAPAFPAHAEAEGTWRIGGRVNEPCAARFEVSDTAGEVVRAIDVGEREPGTVEAVWDGRDNAGRAALGPMFYRFACGERAGPRVPMVDLGMSPSGPMPGEPEPVVEASPSPEPTPEPTPEPET